MYRLTVLYGRPTDPDAFDAYYRDVHLPIASRMRGLTRWTLTWVKAQNGEDVPPIHLIADLYAARYQRGEFSIADELATYEHLMQQFREQRDAAEAALDRLPPRPEFDVATLLDGELSVETCRSCRFPASASCLDSRSTRCGPSVQIGGWTTGRSSSGMAKSRLPQREM